MRTLTVTILVALASTTAVAEDAKKSADPTFIYVPAVSIDKKLAKTKKLDGRAVTSTLCAALAKQPDVQVLCEPDVKQLVAFQAELSALGKSPAITRLEDQVQKTNWLVVGNLLPRGDEVALEIGVHKPGDGGTSLFLIAGERVANYKRTGKNVRELLDHVLPLSARLVKERLVKKVPLKSD